MEPNTGVDEALILESHVLRLSAPTPRVLRAFKRWFLSNPLPVLWGRDKELFRNEQDLVALAPVETDRLNIFLQNYFGWFLKVSRGNISPWTMRTTASRLLRK